MTRQSANSRRPLDHLQYVFALCDPVTFDLILNGQRGLMMDYPFDMSFARLDPVTLHGVHLV